MVHNDRRTGTNLAKFVNGKISQKGGTLHCGKVVYPQQSAAHGHGVVVAEVGGGILRACVPPSPPIYHIAPPAPHRRLPVATSPPVACAHHRRHCLAATDRHASTYRSLWWAEDLTGSCSDRKPIFYLKSHQKIRIRRNREIAQKTMVSHS